MIPFLPPLLLRFPLLAKLPWKMIGYAVAAIAIAWFARGRIDAYGDRRERAGEARIQAKWDADTQARQAATDKAIADAKAAEEQAKTNNAEVLKDANEKLVAIAADRDSLSGLLRQARDQVRAIAASAATSQLGADVAAGIARRQGEIDAAHDEYDTKCRRDAVRFGALQDQIRGQL